MPACDIPHIPPPGLIGPLCGPTNITMKPNMGSADRVIRLIVAAVILGLYLAGTITGTLGIVLLVLAAVFAATAFMRFCPLYLPFGIRTRKP